MLNSESRCKLGIPRPGRDSGDKASKANFVCWGFKGMKKVQRWIHCPPRIPNSSGPSPVFTTVGVVTDTIFPTGITVAMNMTIDLRSIV